MVCLQSAGRAQALAQDAGWSGSSQVPKQQSVLGKEHSSTDSVRPALSPSQGRIANQNKPIANEKRPSGSQCLQFVPSANISRLELDPLEKMSRENQMLITAYRTRIARTKGIASKYQLSVSLQRRLSENMAIAKAKQEEFLRAKLEKREKLQQDALRKFGISATKEDDEKKQLYLQIQEYEQCQEWLRGWRHKLQETPEDTVFMHQLIKLIISTSGHPLAQMLQKYQYLIYDRLQPLVSHRLDECSHIRVPFHGLKPGSALTQSRAGRSCLHSDGGQDSVVPAVVDDVSNLYTNAELATGNKDDLANAIESARQDLEQAAATGENLAKQLTHGMNAEVDEEETFDENDVDETLKDDDLDLESVEGEALQRHAKNIINDVRLYIDRLHEMFLATYEQLNTPLGRDQVHSSLEQPFLERLWPYLLPLFRLINKSKETQLAKAMTAYMGAKPDDMFVGENLCLYGHESVPYSSAICELQRVVHLICPLSKLECVVHVIKIICHSVDEYYTGKASQSPTVGADDLVPVLAYVVVNTGLPQLISECHAIEEFIHEGYLMGEEGYCLISLQTALGYVASLSEKL
ncbi:PREDICTED: VPS9 domain-containing protein 1-like isoform X2 [Priapulus caudatus]|uniref:VPS9 domain-containing protein 1-like isoform X2 n=1 Tax=Priapulus caudatus TaxID=37621 RepID=A0ABM1EKI7_PRICU|nr:PREDICTED: VPS9 domain-containing protein 1-like isoform X2 [Priapulus caudatus]